MGTPASSEFMLALLAPCPAPTCFLVFKKGWECLGGGGTGHAWLTTQGRLQGQAPHVDRNPLQRLLC